MTDVQQAAYGDAEEVASDAVGLLPRSNRNHHKKRRIIESATAADAGDTILEVGCGAGLHTTAYTRQYDVTAVDISPGLVAATRRRAPMATVVEGDARDLPLSDGSVAAVVGTAILHHLPDPAAALQEWQRVTKPGGSVTLMEPNYLFPKDFLSAHLVAEEQHKTMMAPWRVRTMLERVSDTYRHEPRIYTPPWPDRCSAAYDWVDAAGRRMPGGRWLSQMQLIHVAV